MTSNPLVPHPAAEAIVQPAQRPRPRPSNDEIAAWILIGGLILYVMFERIVPSAIGGLALYMILDRLASSLSKHIAGAARPLALILVSAASRWPSRFCVITSTRFQHSCGKWQTSFSRPAHGWADMENKSFRK